MQAMSGLMRWSCKDNVLTKVSYILKDKMIFQISYISHTLSRMRGSWSEPLETTSVWESPDVFPSDLLCQSPHASYAVCCQRTLNCILSAERAMQINDSWWSQLEIPLTNWSLNAVMYFYLLLRVHNVHCSYFYTVYMHCGLYKTSLFRHICDIEHDSGNNGEGNHPHVDQLRRCDWL